jgi:MYXO-CTERM domain-containing protein
MIGYAVYVAGKPVLKRALRARARRTKQVVSGNGGGHRVLKKALIAGAAALGALAFWRRKRSKNQALES